MFIGLDGAIAGLVSVADPVKESTPTALNALRELGFRIILATGDNERTARSVAKGLSIYEIRADVLPQDKARIVSELQDQGNRVAMAGDGVNNAFALAQADVGIAMGTGADVAMESASFTLVKGDLTSIVNARRLSRTTMRNIRQNLWRVNRELKSVDELVEQIDQLTAYTLESRLDGSSLPTELQPLVLQFNDLLERLSNSYKQLENFNADVAHELNTPLTNLMPIDS